VRIAIVSQYYRPENAKITNSLASELAARGHSVRVVTGYPNFPEGVLYPGYKQAWKSEERDGGVLVRRVPIYVSHSANPIGRIANYASFAFSSLQATRFVANADVVYVYATQMTASVAPLGWHLLKRIPFVLHVQDLWPESITGSSMVSGRLNRLIGGLLNPWLRATYRAAAATIAIAPTMGKMLVERGVPRDRIHVVYNWSDEEVPAPTPRGVGDGLTVTYAGNIGSLQALEAAVYAAHEVRDLSGFRLLIVGGGGALESLKELAARLGATNVQFRGRVDPSRMSDIYLESDFQLISLKNIDIFHGTIPSKFQGSLAYGQPVICAVPGDLGQLVSENGIGISAEPENAESLARAFRQAFAMTAEERLSMAATASSFYAERMSIKAGVGAVEHVLASVARLGKRR